MHLSVAAMWHSWEILEQFQGTGESIDCSAHCTYACLFFEMFKEFRCLYMECFSSSYHLSATECCTVLYGYSRAALLSAIHFALESPLTIESCSSIASFLARWVFGHLSCFLD